jgi:hypothetical protein
MSECFNAICGYDDEHEHGDQCTIDCPRGEGRMSAAGEWLGHLSDLEGQQA